MHVALHFSKVDPLPVGIWWPLRGTSLFDCFYVDEHSPYRTRGRTIMQNKVEGASWDRFFHHLAGRAPYLDSWEEVDTGDVWAPQEYLLMLRELGDDLQ